jgi:hypothetical protein
MTLRYRQRLEANLVECHELYKLELPWAWEPRDSSGTRCYSAKKDPSIVFLCEIWMDEDRVEASRCRFNFTNKFVVKQRNKGDGLALFWKQELHVTIRSYSLSHIDVVVNEGTEQAW